MRSGELRSWINLGQDDVVAADQPALLLVSTAKNLAAGRGLDSETVRVRGCERDGGVGDVMPLHRWWNYM